MGEKRRERYWLRVVDSPWQEATREQFIQAEGTAGFYPMSGCGDLATAGFTANGIQGRITYGEINERDYRLDQDFLRAVKGEK